MYTISLIQHIVIPFLFSCLHTLLFCITSNSSDPQPMELLALRLSLRRNLVDNASVSVVCIFLVATFLFWLAMSQ